MFTNKKGFTLIEILIVVAIIALLASIVLVGLGPARVKGRDARRVADIRQMQNALEIWNTKCGSYPQGGVACVGATTPGASTYQGIAPSLISLGAAPIVPYDPKCNGNPPICNAPLLPHGYGYEVE